MLDAIDRLVDGIPVTLIAFACPLAIWAQAVWASPFLKTYRHGKSGFLAVLSGALLAAAILYDNSEFPILFIGAALTMAFMFTALLWPTTYQRPKN
jgi:hypothetical protein